MTTCCPFPLSCIFRQAMWDLPYFPTIYASIHLSTQHFYWDAAKWLHWPRLQKQHCEDGRHDLLWNAKSSWREWCIREQSEYNTKFMFANMWFLPRGTQSAAPSWTRLCGNIWNAHTHPCLKHLPAPPFSNFTMNHKQQYVWHLLPWANIRLFFFKVKCHIYCDIYIFLSHLTYIKAGHHFY